MNWRFICVIGITFLFVASSCKNKNADAEPFLASVGNEKLTIEELRSKIPAGITPDDSIRLARAYIRAWIDDRLISRVASKEIDMTEIDRMTEEYRNRLIMWEYGRQMFDAHQPPRATEDSLRAYYEANREEFRLSRPMVKGVYLKVPDDDKSLSTLRRLYRSTKPTDIDRLEKSELSRAVHYDYFRDRWVDWEQIENRIPYDFGTASDDAFLRAHPYIDTSNGGFTYLLDISDVLPSGSIMPYEVAKEIIAERMKFQSRRTFDLTLRQELFDRALHSGTVTLNTEI